METQDSKNRLFIVGCSYSQYVNPTYGDFLGVDYNKTFNFAKAGAGNRYIFHAAAHIFEEYKPKSNDTVIVQWSGIGRWDHIFNNTIAWTTPGTLDFQGDYPPEVVDKYFNIVAEASNLINYVNAIKTLATVSGCNFATFNMFDPWIDFFFGEPYTTHIFDKYSEYINKYFPFKKLEQTFKKVKALESVEEYIWNFPLEKPLYYYDLAGRQDETHPSTNQHLEYAKYLSKELGLGGDNLHTDKLKHYAAQITDLYSNPEVKFQELAAGNLDGHQWFNKRPTKNSEHFVLQIKRELFPPHLFNKEYEAGNPTEWMQ